MQPPVRTERLQALPPPRSDIKKRVGISWAEPLNTFLDHTTTLAHLVKLEKEGRVSKIEKEKTLPKWFITP